MRMFSHFVIVPLPSSHASVSSMAHHSKAAPVFIPLRFPPRTILTPPFHPLVPPPESYSVTFYGDNIHVTVAKKALHVHQWISYIRRIHRHSFQLLVGLDTEWLPNMAPGEDHPISIIQLCVGRHCLIFQFLHADGIPPSLHAFLADPHHIFCGVGIHGDLRKLYDHHGLWVRCTADLNNLVRLASGEEESKYRYMGLKKMALAVLGKEMKKPLRVTLSKWDAPILDFDQVEYAAVDAFVSFQLAFTLCSWLLH